MKRRDDPNQLLITWGNSEVPAKGEVRAAGQPACQAAPQVPALIQPLPWDFKTSFPEPLDEAIENGVLDESDRDPKNLLALHQNYAAQCLGTLTALDKVLDARRRGVDPCTGNEPRTHAARERLRKYMAEEPARLEHTFEVQVGAYADAFGQDAAEAFKKAIHAWHAGVEVVREKHGDALSAMEVPRKKRNHRVSSALPVPKPLRASVAAGVFGQAENGKPVCPAADEVRAITEQHTERMIDMNDAEMQAAVTKYAEDFGGNAAGQLERYVRRQQRTR